MTNLRPLTCIMCDCYDVLQGVPRTHPQPFPNLDRIRNGARTSLSFSLSLPPARDLVLCFRGAADTIRHHGADGQADAGREPPLSPSPKQPPAATDRSENPSSGKRESFPRPLPCPALPMHPILSGNKAPSRSYLELEA